MWKETYKTGIERIDFQHKALFEKTGELLAAIESEAAPYVYQQMLSFLKGYVVSHFRDEEAYQRSIGYTDYEQHKKAHEAFTAVVLDYEKRLENEHFDIAVVKDLAGTLTAWLTYHVANSDLKMVRGDSMQHSSGGLTPIQTFLSSVDDTLQSVTGMERSQIHHYDAATESLDDTVEVNIDVVGEISGTLTYAYTGDLARNLFAAMTLQQPAVVDELVCSALAEITNISTGNATIQLAQEGVSCDIKPPVISSEQGDWGAFEGIVVDTALGKLKVTVRLDQQ